jgi:hypothetical protein
LQRTDYWSARSLLEQGVSAVGTVYHVKEQVDGIGARKTRITTVQYRFVDARGKPYRGTSVARTSTLQRNARVSVAPGDSISVLYVRKGPATNAWRRALELATADVHAGIFASLFLFPWLFLELYRYTRWLAARRALRARVAAIA